MRAILTLTSCLAACGGGRVPYHSNGDSDADSDSDTDTGTDTGSETDTGTDTESDTDTETETETEPPTSARFLVTAGDFVTGSYGLFSVAEGVAPAYDEIGAGDSDPQARLRDGRAFDLGRAGSNVTELDPGDLSLVRQCGVGDEEGAFANPHDVCIASGKAYVLRYEQTTIGILDLSDCSLDGTIDLSAYADADGIPEMEGCIVQTVKDAVYLFVAVERLDRDAFYACAGDSNLVRIDTGTDTVVDDLTLAACNPIGEIEHDADAALAWVAEVGEYGASGDGGIEEIDLEAFESHGFVVTEADLGGDVLVHARVAEDVGVAIVSTGSFETVLFPFDPRDGTVGTAIYAPGGYSVSDVEWAYGDWVAVADRTIDAPGLVLVDVRSADVVPETPIATGLPPVDLVRLP